FLMMVATFGAFAIGRYDEAVAVMLFYQVGELFQDHAVGKSREAIAAMMDIVPEYANVEQNGEVTQMDPDEVEIGSTIVIMPGERVPLDGKVVSGESWLDTAALTGESVPRRASEGDEIYSGSVNGSGTLRVVTSKVYEDSTVARILTLVEEATDKKAKTEQFITKFARYYTPFVTIAAALLAIVPPLFIGGGWAVWSEWIRRACVFLVISCPCALVISVPLGFFGGIGAASMIGVLVKGSTCIESIARMDTLVFDKTGTLTKGEFKVSEIHPAQGFDEAELLRLAAAAESFSTHPIAESVREAFKERGGAVDASLVTDAAEEAGHGVSVSFDGRKVLAGNAKLMSAHGIAFEAQNSPGTVVFVACEGKYAGSIIISDSVKNGAQEALRDLKAVGVNRTVMLTGDRGESAKAVAAQLGISEVRSDLLPADKVAAVEELLAAEAEGAALGFVGDGLNDAPVLTRADLGFAMGSLGSDAAIEAADVVIMDDDIRKIARVVEISRKTLRIVKQNIWFALAVKALVLVLGALGAANMWAAVFADVGVAVICILNSARALKTKNKKRLTRDC
ncbi:MAG: heavy metal translocating P-type ATPase, partial [Firmicutes bacterium]|nr:heavy metal translocating P-type ATPase [Bacillota bacterium]